MTVAAVDVFHHLGQLAALLLLIELLIPLLIFLGIAGGLAFGLRWVRGKTGWVFGKLHTYTATGTRYVHLGTDYAAKPFILGSGFAETVRETAESIRRRVKSMRALASSLPTVAARPVPAPVAPAVPEETETPVPLV